MRLVDELSSPPARAGAPGHSLLFSPGRIGPVTTKNRVVMPSMTTRAADAEGFVTDATLAYYRTRAEGDVGLITVEMSSPEKVGRHRRFELGLYDDRFLPGLTRLVDLIHSYGAKASIQLGHGGGHTRIDICNEVPIAPSAIPHLVQEGSTETIIPQAMSRDRIAETVHAFAAAADRAARAGFDAVEIHASHGYLISQFLTPMENLREDEYGGSLENRARFALEITRAIRRAVPGLAVIFRINGDDYIPGGGLTPAEAETVSIWAAEAGADAIHVTAGHYRSKPSGAVMIPPMAFPDATFLPFGAAVKRRVSVPVIGVGRLGEPAAAMRAVDDGFVDFVALGRPLLADPDWVRNVRNGRAVRMCIACNTCVDGMRTGGKLHCLVNPTTGRELAFETPRAATASSSRKIAVIGAGPAGLTYASLVGKDNEVTVFEREREAGGAFLLAGEAPLFQGVEAKPESLRRYIRELVRRCEELGVRFAFGTDVADDPGRLDGFDQVVVATGAAYRAGAGPLVTWALRRGVFRWPLLKRVASNPKTREWFYRRARCATGDRWRSCLRRPERVVTIGDALAPGKSQDAIQSACELALMGRRETAEA